MRKLKIKHTFDKSCYFGHLYLINFLSLWMIANKRKKEYKPSIESLYVFAANKKTGMCNHFFANN